MKNNVSNVIKREVYKKYMNNINLTPSEYRKILNNKSSIVGRGGKVLNNLIRKNRLLIGKKYNNWDDSNILTALKVLGRIKSLKKSRGSNVRYNGLSLKTWKLLNLGYNINK